MRLRTMRRHFYGDMLGDMVDKRFKFEIRISPDLIKLVETNPNFQMAKIRNRFEHSNF